MGKTHRYQEPEEYFDEYTLDSFARGWDSLAAVLGNKRARVLPPVPGASAAYDMGTEAAKATLDARDATVAEIKRRRGLR